MITTNDDEFILNKFKSENFDQSISVDLNEKLLNSTRPTFFTGDSFCKVYCSKDCKYCKPMGKFPPEKMVINGLYSNWVTDNILAFGRPSNEYLEKYDIINQFKKHNIKTIINMQVPGEHNFCGFPLDPSGFSYDPNKFMRKEIDYLNFPCDDFGTLPPSYILDIVQAIQHRLAEGKIAIHCHAGHGRTGMIIACYLVFNDRKSGNFAVNYVRMKRVGAIQNKLQLETVLEFAKQLEPLRTVFWINGSGDSSKSDNQKPKSNPKFSLREAVMRQKLFIHGKEISYLQHVPKVIFLCLLKLSNFTGKDETDNGFDFTDGGSSSESSLTLSITQQENQNVFLYNTFIRWNKRIKACFNKNLSKDYARKILKYFQQPYENEKILNETKKKLNENDKMGEDLNSTKDLRLLCQLVLDWFDDLKFPVLRCPDIENMRINRNDDISWVILKLESFVGKTVILVMEFLDQFVNPLRPNHMNLYEIFFSRLTHKNVVFSEDSTKIRKFPSDLKPHLLQIIKDFIDVRMNQK